MGSYVPSSLDERRELLSAVGVSSVDELFSDVPEDVRLRQPLNLPDGLSELELRREITDIAAQNRQYRVILRGAGAYDHYIPSIVTSVTSKEEFVTAYTPYQAELSQGILQSIFEYQTMICALTGMDAANASVYDGASAAAEAAAMCADAKRSAIFVSAAMHPDVIATMKTYCFGAGRELHVIPAVNGITDAAALRELLTDDAAAFFFQQPNFVGMLEPADELCEIAHSRSAKAVMSVNPISLGVLKTPSECGADIAVGEGQPLGIPLSWGGPYLGFMAAKKSVFRKLPGRIVGETVDSDGNRAYVLTLQAREQHIRREKASSNICSNEALCALTAAVYMSYMGPSGLREAASQSASKAHYFAQQLCNIKGISLAHDGEFFHEFLTKTAVPPQKILAKLEEHGILGGLPLDGGILWCVTEKAAKATLDEAAALVGQAMCV